jgi:DNA-binding transcriptional LysR family regulator
MDLLALADFNLVARHGGFGRAARASGRPKATLSRRVSELETALDLRLFERGGHLLRLTEEGRALHAQTGALLTQIEETVTSVATGGDTPRGRLRISAPLNFAQAAMGQIAAGFALRYPEIRLEVTTEDRAVDMIEEGYDLVIRVNPHADETLIGRIFLRDRLVLVAAAGRTEATSGKALPAVIRGTADVSAGWTVSLAGETRRIELDPVLRLSSLVMVRDAVRSGIGVGLLPISLAGRDLKDGVLEHLGDAVGPEISLWALYPSRRLLSPRVSAFLEYLGEIFPTGSPEELATFVG